ncbi:RNA pseudouridylate synthase [Aureococcus anophagefferens]|nr:RNA pseudouridylate synthase [Aureococcus anophagefferens]
MRVLLLLRESPATTARRPRDSPLQQQQQHHAHFLLYKPDGVLSQFVTRAKVKKRHRFLGDLGHAFPAGTMAVGRLDRATEGLLLLTTDGRLSYHVTTAGRVEKEYWAELDGVISDGALAALERGVDVGVRGAGGRARSAPYAARAVAATRLAAPPPLPPRRRRVPAHRPHSWVALTVLDGKYHQVRKMTAAVGFPTLRLVRARIGHLRVGAMRPGDVAPLDAAALGALAPPPAGPDGRR